MPRRIEIELTSASPDGSWTWRAAGARNPKGVVDASVLPDGSKVGDELKVEVEQMLDGMEIISVVQGRQKAERTDLLELLVDDKPFEAVIETRAKRGRGERRGRDDDRGGGRGRDGDKRGRGRDGDSRGRGRDGDSRGRGRDGDNKARDGANKGRDGDSRGRGRDGDSERTDRPPRKPRFEAPPEVPQRPKPKRLRPGKTHRQAVLADLPEEQRPIAELALQGMKAVRDRIAEENAKLKAADKPEMPQQTVVKMAESLLPKLRVAEWLDRAEAAQRQMQHLDLRDLRSVVASSADPTVARDTAAQEIADELKKALAQKQAEEMANWLEDVEAAIGVGRVIRALRLSSQPPKAGVMFPPELARRLGEAATASLLPDDTGDRWSAVLEAAAFSPVRALVVPTVPPKQIDDDLKKTALRLGPLLPQVAALLGVEVPADAPRPKPLRPQYGKNKKDAKGRDGKPGESRGGRDDRGGRGGRDDRDGRGGRGGRGGRDDRGGRGGNRPPKDRPKGMRDVAEVMAAKKAEEAAAAAAEEAAAAAAAEAEAKAAEAASADETPAADATDTATDQPEDAAAPAADGAATDGAGDDAPSDDSSPEPSSD